METFRFKVQVPVGIHVRNAMLLSQKAGEYQSNVRLWLGQASADAKKLMELMILRVKCGDEIRFTIEGPDEAEAVLAIKNFCEKNF